MLPIFQDADSLQVLLVGDSAGGNLALGLLSHFTHPNPLLPALSSASPIKGLQLISPWVTFELASPSVTRNMFKDNLSIGTLEIWGAAYTKGTTQDEYTTPLKSKPEWWREMKVKSISVIAGQDELFVDDIEHFVKIVKVSHYNS